MDVGTDLALNLGECPSQHAWPHLLPLTHYAHSSCLDRGNTPIIFRSSCLQVQQPGGYGMRLTFLERVPLEMKYEPTLTGQNYIRATVAQS